jgi:two-component system cell cycle sensor histidine kinase PleC
MTRQTIPRKSSHAPSSGGSDEEWLALALTRGVLDSLKTNRIIIPFFALAVCAMFSQWIRPATLFCWYALVMVSLIPTIIVSRRFPSGDLPHGQVRQWVMLVSASNLIFVAAWTSMGWWLWIPGNDFDHLLLQLGLAASLAASSAVVGPSPQISLPSFACYALSMTMTPLQARSPTYNWLAFITLFYVSYVAMMARRHYYRARAALVLADEKNVLIEALALSKAESDAARDRAEAASLAKSQFLANMSHELRTPLNAIIGFSEMISARVFEDPEKHYEYAALIHSSGYHLLALINDILDLAKIEAGKWRLEEGAVDLQMLAASAVQLVSWKAAENSLGVALEISEGLPMIFADERALKQMWLNLLSNAVKFTRAGVVTAFAKRDNSGDILLGDSDTGIGIAPADQPRVFETFGQGKHDVAVADKGTGLGLAIVRGLAEAHGGSVTLSSEVGKGTTVTISLPQWRVIRAAGERACRPGISSPLPSTATGRR